jgi:sulfur carrier protein ThiS
MPGEMTLARFVASLGQGPESVVVEMEIILHYHDAPDEALIKGEMTLIRNTVYLLLKEAGPAILGDPEVRRRYRPISSRPSTISRPSEATRPTPGSPTSR